MSSISGLSGVHATSSSSHGSGMDDCRVLMDRLKTKYGVDERTPAKGDLPLFKAEPEGYEWIGGSGVRFLEMLEVARFDMRHFNSEDQPARWGRDTRDYRLAEPELIPVKGHMRRDGVIFLTPPAVTNMAEYRLKQANCSPLAFTLKAQFVQQDQGVIVLPDCDLFLTPHLTGCALFSCRVGDCEMMFHVNSVDAPASFRPVAVNILTRLGGTDFARACALFERLAGVLEFPPPEADHAASSAKGGELLKMTESLKEAIRAENSARATELTGRIMALEDEIKALRTEEMNIGPGTMARAVSRLSRLLARADGLDTLCAVNPPYKPIGEGAGLDYNAIRNEFTFVAREGGRLQMYMMDSFEIFCVLDNQDTAARPILQGAPRPVKDMTPGDFLVNLERLAKLAIPPPTN